VKVVLDTNVFVSAAIQNGASHQIIQELFLNSSIELIICDAILDELRGVLISRPRLRKWIAVNDAESYLEMLQMRFDLVQNPHHIIPISRDRNDDFILALARREQANYIVSGDKDLLVLQHLEISIVSPTAFIEILKSSSA
jgi:putative PIN family toxin of toxin-antitoxin system